MIYLYSNARAVMAPWPGDMLQEVRVNPNQSA